MKVLKQNGIYKATRITGPKHNFLGLALTRVEPVRIQCVEKRLANNEVVQIDEEKLRSAVSEGALIANRQLHTSIFIERIEYVPTDTPDYSAYIELAQLIVRSAHGDFD